LIDWIAESPLKAAGNRIKGRVRKSPVCATRIPDPRLRRAIEGLNSVRDLEALPLIWREPGVSSASLIWNQNIQLSPQGD
jgi:hypothetical protein